MRFSTVASQNGQPNVKARFLLTFGFSPIVPRTEAVSVVANILQGVRP